jgi:hypothetical protein
MKRVKIESDLGWVEVPVPEITWPGRTLSEYLKLQQAIEIGVEVILARSRKRKGVRVDYLAEDDRLLRNPYNLPASKLWKLVGAEKSRWKTFSGFTRWLARRRAQMNRPVLNDKVDRGITENWAHLYNLKPVDALAWLKRKGILKVDSHAYDARWYRRRIERLGKQLGRLKPRVQQEPPRTRQA